jgi:hypothetical protein
LISFGIQNSRREDLVKKNILTLYDGYRLSDLPSLPICFTVPNYVTDIYIILGKGNGTALSPAPLLLTLSDTS